MGIGHGDISYQGDSTRIGALSSPTDAPGFAIVVNNQGGFWNDVNGSGGINPGMKRPILGGGFAAQEFILLHELAHDTGVFRDDQNNKDPNINEQNQELNNQDLEKNCAKTLGII